jgi:hypothetical protein
VLHSALPPSVGCLLRCFANRSLFLCSDLARVTLQYLSAHRVADRPEAPVMPTDADLAGAAAGDSVASSEPRRVTAGDRMKAVETYERLLAVYRRDLALWTARQAIVDRINADLEARHGPSFLSQLMGTFVKVGQDYVAMQFGARGLCCFVQSVAVKRYVHAAPVVASSAVLLMPLPCCWLSR